MPDYVQRDFENYLECGRLEHGFLCVRCVTCHEECSLPAENTVPPTSSSNHWTLSHAWLPCQTGSKFDTCPWRIRN